MKLWSRLIALCLALACPGQPAKAAEGSRRAVVLLPRDRSQAGAITFQLEEGPHAGLHRCEALGRGLTAREPRPGWLKGLINGTTIYYAPVSEPDGATVPGIYDLRNITPDRYDIVLLNKPEDLTGEKELLARLAPQGASPKPGFSGVWKHWYSQASRAVPIDMVWAEDSQQAPGPPVFERRPQAASDQERARQAKHLEREPRYYFGPYGRQGFAVHTDRWDDPDRRRDPAYAGRPELSDFRFRDTNGCVKVRPGCLELLNEFVAEQTRRGRRAQAEVREVPSLDAAGR